MQQQRSWESHIKLSLSGPEREGKKLSLDGPIETKGRRIIPAENRLKVAVVTLAILIDKMMLLDAQPTGIQDINTKHEQRIMTEEEAEASIMESCRVLGLDPAMFLSSD